MLAGLGFLFLTIFLAIGMLYSVIYGLKIKEKKLKDLLTALWIYIISGILAFVAFTVAYNDKIVIALEEKNGNQLGGDPDFFFEPVYKGENLGHFILLGLPVIILLTWFYFNPERKQKVKEWFLILIPWYITFSYILIFTTVNMDKPKYYEDDNGFEQLSKKYKIIPY